MAATLRQLKYYSWVGIATKMPATEGELAIWPRR